MADNAVKYGFRWWTAHRGGARCPAPIEYVVQTGASFDVNGGGANVTLGAGDPVTLLTDGTVTLCEGTEDTPLVPFGIVASVLHFFNGTFVTKASLLPSDTNWGTIEERASRVLVVPVDAGTWEVDVDENTTATTAAAYRDMIGENVDHVLTGQTALGRALPKLDISTNATTGTLMWRIVGTSLNVENQDLAELNVKLLVQPNVAQLPWSSATGI